MQQSLRYTLILICFTLLTACDVLPTTTTIDDSRTDTSDGVETGRTPLETIETFLLAWENEDFTAMHSLLSPRSVEVYSLEDFTDLYETAHADMDFTGISYTLGDVTVQGTSASIAYDVVLETATFGDITDSNRTLRLVEESNRWAIAWSPMDIINGMTANVRLDPNRTFPRRGNIYDTNGQFLVNETGTTYRLIMRLSDMRGEAECTTLLSRLLLRPESYFEALYVDFRSADSAFFVGEIDGETLTQNRTDLDNICGTDVVLDFIGNKIQPIVGRTYFGHGAATHITGYVGRIPIEQVDFWQSAGYSDTDLVGLAGVEFAFQDALAGSPDQSLRLIDSSGVTLRELGQAEGNTSSPITLTVDRDLQWSTAQAFIDAWSYAGRNWATRATGGAAIILDVNTGAVRTMFSFPTYDPRIFYPESGYYATSTVNAGAVAQIENATNDLFPAINNRAYGEQYSPGSVFKILSVMAAVDSGIWQPNQIFNCELTWDGSSQGDTVGIREDWRVVDEQEAAGEITPATALTTSCNPFFWEVGALMYNNDSDLLYSYALDWGFNQPTNIIGLEDPEASGTIPLPESVTEAINDVIGQGDTQVTTIQMAQLVAAVANGGTIYQPYIIEQVGGRDGSPVTQTFDPVIAGELGVSAAALQVAIEGMCNVPIDPDYGTSISTFSQSAFFPPNYSHCGKTGTAQTTGAPNAWYVGFAPPENPQIAFAVVVPNSRQGSEVTAPIARRILDAYFNAPVAPYPEWWEEDYIPVSIPQGLVVEDGEQ